MLSINFLRFSLLPLINSESPGEILSSLVILALDEINPANIDNDTANKIKAILQKENPSQLKRNLLLTSARNHDYILTLLK